MKKDTKKSVKAVFHILFWVYFAVAAKILIFRVSPDVFFDLMRTWNRSVIYWGLSRANFVPFKTVKMYMKYYAVTNSFTNLAGNLVIFMPLGFLLPFTWKKKHGIFAIAALGFLISMGVEVTQLVTGLGAFDVDDLILNTAGAVIGYLIYKIMKLLFSAVDRTE
ncbi:MAG: VanZ family protein [Lachnospiraceae bacterium]|nr:VanZ family protein [Lachnospiraceae bacterium]MBR5944176.1 VanZ family protein [Lachnospiraceae bacterium]